LGHQAIGEYFGATLTRASKPMHGKISAIRCESDELFEKVPLQIEVVRYHSLIVRNIPAILKVIAHTVSSSEEIMALRHRRLPVHGIQFHPEAALTEYGLQIIYNWLNFAGVVD
jgi:anthranilate synthase component 2